MNASYMPSRLANQVAWSARFVQVVGGNPARYGVPADLMTQFTTINSQLQVEWLRSENEQTRTKGSISDRNVLLRQMRDAAKNLVSIIQGTPSVTDSMKIDAGLTVRKTKPTKKNPPTTSPIVKLSTPQPRQILVQLGAVESKLGKAPNAIGATIFVYFGTTPPPMGEQWSFLENTTKRSTTIDLGPATGIETVWVTAFWYNATGESGPTSEPRSIQVLPGGTLPRESAPSTSVLKAA
jgi:hypothetical protein